MAAFDITKPEDTALVRNYPTLARTDKTTLQTDLQVEHDVLLTAGGGTGRHKFQVANEASLAALSAVPVGSIAWALDKKRMRIKTATGPDVAEQVPFPTGTRMVFDQDTVPTGWTRQTDVHDRLIRIVNGNTGALTGTAHTGGASLRTISGVGTLFSTELAVGDAVDFGAAGKRTVVAIASATAMTVDTVITISGPPGNAISKVARVPSGGQWVKLGLTLAGTTEGHALTVAQLASHFHGVANGGGAGNFIVGSTGNSDGANTQNTTSTGSGENHQHPLGANGSVNSDGTWRPADRGMLVGAKD